MSNHNAVVIADDITIANNFFKLNWSNVLAGDYVLTARATDNSGESTVSGPIHIRVF